MSWANPLGAVPTPQTLNPDSRSIPPSISIQLGKGSKCRQCFLLHTLNAAPRQGLNSCGFEKCTQTFVGIDIPAEQSVVFFMEFGGDCKRECGDGGDGCVGTDLDSAKVTGAW